MLSIPPITEVKLRHVVHHLAVAESGHVYAMAHNGAGSVLAPDHRSCTPFTGPAGVTDLALSRDGRVMAVAANDTLVLTSTATGETIHRGEGRVECCCFAPLGELWTSFCSRRRGGTYDAKGVLWTMPPSANSEDERDILILEVRERVNWRVIARTEIADPWGGSNFVLMPNPDPQGVTVFGCGGENGQGILWARRAFAKIEIDEFPGVESPGVPSFHRAGDRFLIVSNENELQQHRFPKGPLLGSVRWPLDTIADGAGKSNRIGLLTQYADSNRALFQTGANRLYLVALDDMSVVDEIAICSHGLLTGATVSPGTGQDDESFSDLGSVVVLTSGQLLSTHRDYSDPSSETPSDSVVTWRLPPGLAQ